MNLQHDPSRPLLIRVGMLPRWGFANSLIQGERHSRTKLWEQEHQRWILALRDAGLEARDTALFPGRCTVEATFFRPPKGGAPDEIDNMFLALKPLWDVLQVHKTVWRRTKAGLKPYVSGYFGIYENDRLLRWGTVPEIVVTRDYGADGLTQIIITPRGGK